jgi:hypothetical protein
VGVRTSLNDLATGDQMLQHLGTYWAVVFGGSRTVNQLMRAEALSQGQNYLNYLETVACLSRFTVPVFHTENWYQLTIRLSAVSGVASRYDPNDLVYGPQPGTTPDRPAGFIQTYGGQDRPGIVELDLPDNLVSINFNIQNFVVKPTKIWTNGVDYSIVAGRLTFRDNPFLDDAVPKRDIFNADGVKVDEEIALWVYKGEFDLNYVYIQFGYALGLQLGSSQFYKDILNAFWDMHLLGPAVNLLEILLAAMAGTALVVNPVETVEVIWRDNEDTLVITDSTVYQFTPASNISVSVGQKVFAGDPLTDAVRVTELSGAGADLSSQTFPALSLSAQFLSGHYLSDLTFRNSSVALDYLGINAAGKAVVQFEVSGFPGDVEAFWGRVQANGEMPHQRTLAELLDTRANPVGQPGPLNLPATVNPLRFVLDNLLRNNLFVIRVNRGGFDPGAPGIEMMRLLREVMPPHVNYVVLINIDTLADDFDLGQAGGTDEGGATDAAVGFFGPTGSLLDTAYEVHSSPGGPVLTYGDKAVFARLYSLTCQEGQ